MAIRTRELQLVIGAQTGVYYYFQNTADINAKTIYNIEWLFLGQKTPATINGVYNCLPITSGTVQAMYLCLRDANTLDWRHFNLPLTALGRSFSGNLAPALPGVVASNVKNWKRYTGKIDWTTSYVISNFPPGAAINYYITLLITYEDGNS